MHSYTKNTFILSPDLLPVVGQSKQFCCSVLVLCIYLKDLYGHLSYAITMGGSQITNQKKNKQPHKNVKT